MFLWPTRVLFTIAHTSQVLLDGTATRLVELLLTDFCRRALAVCLRSLGRRARSLFIRCVASPFG
jgi:hypothetical protein